MDKSVEFYEEEAKHAKDEGFCIYGRKVSQLERFTAVKRLLPLDSGTLLEIGCGTGDFYDFLGKSGSSMLYKGFDTSPAMIKFCQERFKSESGFEEANLLEKNLAVNSFDWVVAIGVFIIRHGNIADEDVLLKQMMEEMYRVCRKGMAITCLSSYMAVREDETVVHDPEKVFSFAKRLSERVVLDHGYMPHDFTIAIYKEKSEWRKEWDSKGGW